MIYDLARAYALAGKHTEALAALEKVAAIGGVAAFGAAQQKDFASLSQTDEFKTVVNKIASMKIPVINSEIAYRIPERNLIPEGMAYDPVARTLYIGSTYKRKIISISDQGIMKNFISEKQDGIWGVLGLQVDSRRRLLWAAADSGNMPGRIIGIEERDYWNAGVFKYDLDTGRLIRKYVLEQKPNAHLLNGLAVASNGDLFITDMQAGAIYMIRAEEDELKLFLKTPRLKFASGIALADDDWHLFVAHGLGLEVIDLRTGMSHPLAHAENMTLTGIDGLSFYRGSLIAHQNATLGRIVRYYLSEDMQRVERMETIDAHRPDFNIPTTGAVAGDAYYYIANSQLRSFRDGGIFPMNELRDVIMLRAKL